MTCMKKMAEMNVDELLKFISTAGGTITSDVIVAGKMPMTGNEYQIKAMRTCSINDNEKDKLLHGVFGLNSEAGEIAGLFQKEYQGHQIDKEHLVKECGDCLWMIAEILDAIGVDLETCMIKNIEKLKARYPDGFDPEKSLHRKPGDV